MSPYFHAVFHNAPAVLYREGNTAGTRQKHPTKDCNDMLPVLEWVFPL